MSPASATRRSIASSRYSYLINFGVIGRTSASAIGAIVIVGAWLVGASAAWFPLTHINIDRGERIFQHRCASCHATQGATGSAYGPDLSNIGAEANSRIAGMSSEVYLLQSIQNPSAYRQPGEQGVMPANVSVGLTEEDVLSLVGYLKTQNGTLDMGRLLSLRDKVETQAESDNTQVNLAAVEEGKQLFQTKGKCQDCHLLRDIPGMDLRAPSLLSAGHHDAEYLKQSIRDPSEHILLPYAEWQILLASGKQMRGRVLHEDENEIDLLMTSSAPVALATIKKDDIDSENGELMITRSGISPMPKYGLDSLSDDELNKIVAFLKTLR